MDKNNKNIIRFFLSTLSFFLRERLEALGLTEGAKITILNNNKKGALTARFRGTRFALGKRIADHIEVKEVTE